MKKNFLKNLFINFFTIFLTGILGFIINKKFAIHMGIDKLGLMKLFTQMVAYLSLVDLGIGNATSYALYKPLEEKNIVKISTVVSTISSFYKKIAIIIFIIGLSLSFIIPFFINFSENNSMIYIYWILYVVNTCLSYTFAKYPIIFTANQEYGFVRMVQGSGKIIFQLLQVLILIKLKSFTLFISVMILENIYCYCIYKYHYKRKYNFIKNVKEKEDTIMKNMKNMFWHKIGGLIVFNTDYIILSKFTTLSIVGIYSSYLMVYQMVLTIMNILTPVLRPLVGIFIVKNSSKKIYIYWRKLYSFYVMLSTGLIIYIYIFITPFMKLWLGEEFVLPNTTVILILLNLFIHLTRGITDVFKECCGFFDDILMPIFESGINFILSIILVRKIGLNGVIFGTLASNVIVIFLWRPILVFNRCFGKKAIDYLNDLLKLLGLSFFSGFLVMLILRILKINFSKIYLWSQFISISFVVGFLIMLTVFVVFLGDIYFRKNLMKYLKRLRCEKYRNKRFINLR